MRVAFVSQPWDTVGPSVSASIGILTYQVTRRLAQSNDVIVYTKLDGSQKKVELSEGVEHRRIATEPDKRLIQVLDRLAGLYRVERPLFASSLYYLGYVLQVALDLRRQRCDIVHIHNFSQFVPIIRAINPRIKIVLHMSCEWLTQLDREMIGRRISQADLIIGCSEYISEKVRRTFPQFAHRCQTVFNGVDTDHFVGDTEGGTCAGENPSKRILFVGRVSPEKGLHVLVNAFQEVARFDQQVELTIVGPEQVPPIEFLVGLDEHLRGLTSFYPKSYLAQLRKMLSPNIAGRVSFTGSVSHFELSRLYRDAYMLINPSFSEAFGMSLVEASAAQIPVIATRVGGMVEIVVDGKTGLLVSPGDPHALAEAILQLLSDEARRKSMGRAGRQRVLELFSWERVVESLLRNYESIHENNGKAVSEKSTPSTM